MYYSLRAAGSVDDRPADFCVSDDHVICDWEALRTQLLYKWQLLTPTEVDNAGPSRSRIAQLVESKYGIAAICVESYLINCERMMPL